MVLEEVADGPSISAIWSTGPRVVLAPAGQRDPLRQSGDRTLWRAGDDAHVGESVFAADPDGTAEDHGWLVNAVYHSDTDHTDVCVLDARDVAAGPVARVRMPRRIPFGFHASWFPAG